MAAKPPRHTGLSTPGVRDIVQRQIGDALAALRKEKDPADEAIHAARKELKRARAGLRLLRGAIGTPVYMRENAALRDAARPLGRVRDAKVMLETIEQLLARERQPGRRTVLLGLRRVLREARLRLRRDAQRAEEYSKSAQALEEARRRVERWRVRGDGRAVVLGGVERIYRKGRKALAAVDAERSDENLHELRKQAKYLGQALEIPKATSACGLAKLIKRAESIADRLGGDHDLVVLQDKMTALPSGSQKAQQALPAEIQRRPSSCRRRLRKRAGACTKGSPKLLSSIFAELD